MARTTFWALGALVASHLQTGGAVTLQRDMLNTSDILSKAEEYYGWDEQTAERCFTAQFTTSSCFGGVSCMMAKACGKKSACTKASECKEKTNKKTGATTTYCHPAKCSVCGGKKKNKGQFVHKTKGKGLVLVPNGKCKAMICGATCNKKALIKKKDACEAHYRVCDGGGRVQKCLAEYQLGLTPTTSDKSNEWSAITGSLSQKKPVALSLSHDSKGGAHGHAVIVVAAAEAGAEKFIGISDPWGRAQSCTQSHPCKDYNGNERAVKKSGIHWFPYVVSGPVTTEKMHNLAKASAGYRLTSGYEGTRVETYYIPDGRCEPEAEQCAVTVTAKQSAEDDAAEEDGDASDNPDEEDPLEDEEEDDEDE